MPTLTRLEETLTEEQTLITTDEMISLLLCYESAKQALEQEQEIGRRVIEQVKANVEADLKPRAEEIEYCRRSIEAYIRQNNGARFKAPGLGTAFLSRRKSVKVVDDDDFVEWFDALPEEPFKDNVRELIFPTKFSASGAKKIAEQVLTEDGEILPGVSYEELETLTVRLSGGKS